MMHCWHCFATYHTTCRPRGAHVLSKRHFECADCTAQLHLRAHRIIEVEAAACGVDAAPPSPSLDARPAPEALSVMLQAELRNAVAAASQDSELEDISTLLEPFSPEGLAAQLAQDAARFVAMLSTPSMDATMYTPSIVLMRI